MSVPAFSYRELTNLSDALLTCEVCGHKNSPDRAFYWGTCSECESAKGAEKASLLPVCGHYAAGTIDEYDYGYAAGAQRIVAAPQGRDDG